MQLCDTISAVPLLISPLVAALLITSFGGLTVAGIRPLYAIQVIGFSLIVVGVLWKFINPLKMQRSAKNWHFREGVRAVFTQGIMVGRWIVCVCLSTIPMFINQIYLPKFVEEIKGADQFVIGGMATAAALMPLILSIGIGKLADTIGRKKVIYLTLPLYCTSIILLVYASNSTMLYISGIFQGFYMLSGVTQGAITAELIPSSLLGFWYGILGLFRGLTSLIIPIVGGLIWTTFSPGHLFLFVVITQGARIVILHTMPETLKDRS
jgi:MFS family permease